MYVWKSHCMSYSNWQYNIALIFVIEVYIYEKKIIVKAREKKLKSFQIPGRGRCQRGYKSWCNHYISVSKYGSSPTKPPLPPRARAPVGGPGLQPSLAEQV